MSGARGGPRTGPSPLAGLLRSASLGRRGPGHAGASFGSLVVLQFAVGSPWTGTGLHEVRTHQSVFLFTLVVKDTKIWASFVMNRDFKRDTNGINCNITIEMIFNFITLFYTFVVSPIVPYVLTRSFGVCGEKRLSQ